MRDDAQFQVFLKFAVLLDQEVVGPAVDPQRRDPAVVDLLDECERVLGSSSGRLAEDRDELGTALRGLGGVEAGEAQGAGMRVDAGERVGVLQTKLDRAVAAHREAANGAAGALGLDRERAVDQANDVLDQVVLISIAGPGTDGVGVPAPAAVGHDNDQREPGRIALDAGAPHPDRVVVGQAMEQVERSPGTGNLGVVGKDHVEGRGLVERVAMVVDRGTGHQRSSALGIDLRSVWNTSYGGRPFISRSRARGRRGCPDDAGGSRAPRGRAGPSSSRCGSRDTPGIRG